MGISPPLAFEKTAPSLNEETLALQEEALVLAMARERLVKAKLK